MLLVARFPHMVTNHSDQSMLSFPHSGPNPWNFWTNVAVELFSPHRFQQVKKVTHPHLHKGSESWPCQPRRILILPASLAVSRGIMVWWRCHTANSRAGARLTKGLMMKARGNDWTELCIPVYQSFFSLIYETILTLLKWLARQPGRLESLTSKIKPVSAQAFTLNPFGQFPA